MRSNILLWILFFIAMPCAAQVGIGTVSPSSSAALDISSTSKGLLLPRLTMQQIKNIAEPVAGLTLYNTDQNKPCFFNGTDWLHYDNSLVLPKLGMYHPLAGGIVIYLDASGIHGLAAAMESFGSFIPWGCFGTNIPAAQSSAIGSGQSNTNAILAACTTAGVCAQLCNDFVHNDFSDWYMPSIDEVSLMYAVKDSLPALAAGRYWSSTQVNSDQAQIRDFTTGEILFMPKSSGRYVRAVRTF